MLSGAGNLGYSKEFEQQFFTGQPAYLNQFVNGVGQSTARSVLGSLGVLASVGQPIPNGTGNTIYAEALADWADYLTINASGQNGNEGMLTFVLHPNGTLKASGVGSNWSADASISLLVQTNTGTAFVPATLNKTLYGIQASETIMAPPQVHITGTDFTQQPLVQTVPFQFGTQLILELRIDGTVHATVGVPINSCKFRRRAGVLFLDSLDWGGITQVTDANGNVIPNFTVTSVSGTNYLGLIVAPLPLANAGPDQTAQVGTLVTLDGSASSDPTGQLPLTYTWTLVSTPTGSAATLSDPTIVNPTFTPDVPGNYLIQLVISDVVGLSSALAAITVSTANSPPLANGGPDQTVTSIGTVVQLDGSASDDPDGQSITYLSSILSKPVGSNAKLTAPTTVNPSFVADINGDYSVQLIVTDSLGPASIRLS